MTNLSKRQAEGKLSYALYVYYRISVILKKPNDEKFPGLTITLG